MTVNEAKQKVITVAVSNLNYHETGNNHTKFTEGSWDNQFYGWELDGQPWCDVYADYCYCKPFGIEKGKQLTYQTAGGSALCRASAQYYKNNNAWFNYPENGDQAFFYSNGDINHTGIVETVQGDGKNWTSFTCIEGNSSDQVARRTYQRGNSRIAGFGRPNWKVVAGDNAKNKSTPAEETTPTTPTPVTPIKKMTVTRYGEKSNAVKDLQEKLMLLGYNVGKDGADGVFGRNTLNAVKNFQREHGLTVDGEVGDQTRAALEQALKTNRNINKPAQATLTVDDSTIKKGDYVKIKEGATWYNSKVSVPQFILNDVWIVYSISGSRVVINKNLRGTYAIMSPIDIKNLIKV